MFLENWEIVWQVETNYSLSTGKHEFRTPRCALERSEQCYNSALMNSLIVLRRPQLLVRQIRAIYTTPELLQAVKPLLDKGAISVAQAMEYMRARQLVLTTADA